MQVGSKRPSQDCSYDHRAKKKSNLIAHLCQAVQDNDANKCRELLENHDQVDVNEKCANGNTALHEASKVNNTEISALLLNLGADPNSKNDHGCTPLHVCSQHNSEEVSELLLKSGSDVHAQNAYKNTPLHLAATYNSLEVCKKLLDNDSDINAEGINFCTPLHLAVEHNCIETCQELLERQAHVNEKCANGNTALHEASKVNNTEISTLLLNLGADPNSKNDHGCTPLHVCSQHNSEEVSELLLKSGSDVHAQNAYKNTPLHLAATYNSLEVCKKLLDNDSDINAEGINFCTPLHLAVEHNCIETCQELLEQQANVNVLRKGKRTPLHDAASKSDGDKLCRLLIEYGADINAANGNGNTALHICCEILNKLPQKVSKMKKAGYRNIMKTLLTYGADPSKKNLHGSSCFELYKSNQEIHKSLQGAKELSLFQKWVDSNPISKKHSNVLSEVCKGQNSERVSSYEYSTKAIGSGAFGQVYAGICVKDGREVAVKKIDTTKLRTAEHKREIKNLVRLRGCKNIVNYIDFYEKKDIHFIVLELMEGPLEEFLDDPASERVSKKSMCKDVVEALYFLHNNNIIHRDIKPNNILYTTGSERVTLKLADFGLSTQIENETSTVMHTAAGTKCWMAPEVINSLDYSKASDVLSAGLVLYYMLANKKHAFASESESSSSQILIEHEITSNILDCKLNIGACKEPEAHHLIGEMLDSKKENRPTSKEVLNYPFFWKEKNKVDFLLATANQPDVFNPSGSIFEQDLESSLGIRFRTKDWSGWSTSVGNIYNEMLSSGRRRYDTKSATHLLRFIRNAYQHASDGIHTDVFKKLLFDDFVFLREFNFLFADVYKVVKKHHWDVNCEEVRNVVLNLAQC